MTVIKVDTLKSLLRKLLFENYLVLFSFFRTLRLLSSYELLIVIMIFIADKAIQIPCQVFSRYVMKS
jgi:hypothetical protein